MCVIPATPSLYFLGVNCLQFPGSSGCGKQQTSCLCCVPLVHKAAISYQGKLESLNKQIWVVWGVQEPVSRGCWTVPNTQTATAVVGSQLWLRTLFKGCSLWVFDRRWVGGWQWSLTLFASCHQYLKQMDPPLLWAEDKWWPVLSIFSRVSLGCQPAILGSWQQSECPGGEIHRFSFPVVLQERRNKVFAQLLLLLQVMLAGDGGDVHPAYHCWSWTCSGRRQAFQLM